MPEKEKVVGEVVAPKQRRAPRGHKVTQDMTGALVQVINLPLAFVVPDYALTPIEADALTVALADLAAQNAWVSNLIYNLVTAQRYGEMPIVLGAIAINRLVIAKKLPPMMGMATGGMLEMVASHRKGGGEEEPKKSHKRKADAESEPLPFVEEKESGNVAQAEQAGGSASVSD